MSKLLDKTFNSLDILFKQLDTFRGGTPLIYYIEWLLKSLTS
jgi:hypothetical protein